MTVNNNTVQILTTEKRELALKHTAVEDEVMRLKDKQVDDFKLQT